MPKIYNKHSFDVNFLVPRRVNILVRDPPSLPNPTSFTIHTRGLEYKAASDASLSPPHTFPLSHTNTHTHARTHTFKHVLKMSVLLTFTFFLSVFKTQSTHFSLYASSFIVNFPTIEELKRVPLFAFSSTILLYARIQPIKSVM